MTKKDYIKLAEIIRRNTVTQSIDGYKFIGFREDFLNELCDVLKNDNPHFNKETFLKACDARLGD